MGTSWWSSGSDSMCFHCTRHRCGPWLGMKTPHATWHGKKQLKQRSEKPPAFSSPTFPGPPRVALVI